MAKEAKTNAMRMLDRQKVKYEAFTYECDEFIDGLHSSPAAWQAHQDQLPKADRRRIPVKKSDEKYKSPARFQYRLPK